jgi:hypothetical protein
MCGDEELGRVGTALPSVVETVDDGEMTLETLLELLMGVMATVSEVDEEFEKLCDAAKRCVENPGEGVELAEEMCSGCGEMDAGQVRRLWRIMEAVAGMLEPLSGGGGSREEIHGVEAVEGLGESEVIVLSRLRVFLRALGVVGSEEEGGEAEAGDGSGKVDAFEMLVMTGGLVMLRFVCELVRGLSKYVEGGREVIGQDVKQSGFDMRLSSWKKALEREDARVGFVGKDGV